MTIITMKLIHMDNITKQRLKLEQQKARVIMEEAKLKIKERKARTRRLIEMGGLVVKARLECLPASSLLGALVTLQNELIQHPSVQDKWTQVGKDTFDLKYSMPEHNKMSDEVIITNY